MQIRCSNRLKRFFLTLVGLFSMTMLTFSQVDYEFWFAAPYGNTDHAPYWPESYPYKVGGRPIYLRLATQDADADVTITMPALGITIANLSIDANSTASVDLTPYINNIQCSKTGNEIEEKGIYIRSNALITAYYEIASVLNTDIFSLKGQNALGKEFYAPFQNMMVNDPYHNGEGVPDNNVSGDGAYSYIVIVATQDNTIVNVTPTTNCVGIASGATKSVTLQRGETYVVRATGQDVSSRLSGTHIVSTKPIAVTIGEDSAYPDYYTNSGDCEDYIGDQLVPVSVIGKEYIVVQGQGYSAAKNTANDFYEIVAITATMDNTIVKVDGAQYGNALQKGETISIELTDPNARYTFIQASNPVYAFHISGYKCEVAGALLPSVEMCSGSYKMGFVRTYGSQNDQEFYMNLMVKGDGEKDFLLNNEVNSVINNATFESIDGTDWKVSRIYFSRSDMPEGAYFLQNTTSLFHMGMMNSTAHDWGDGEGYRLMGSMYGYFSRFSDNYPSAKIVNNNDTSITVTRNTKVSLLADGGYKFSWKGYMWDGHDWALLDAPYFLNETDVENPYVKIDALGIYKYVATITTACYDDVERSVLIKIVEPVDLNTVYDTVCYTPGLSDDNDMSQYYNLFNLNDTIVGKKGLVTGFYVDHFEKFQDADTIVWDDFEDNRPMATNISISNGSIRLVANPDIENTVNTSEYVGYLKRTSSNGGNTSLQTSVYLDFDVSSDPIDLAGGSVFSFDIRYDSSSTQWCSNDHQIYLELIDGGGSIYSYPATSFPTVTDYQEANVAWEHVVCDMSGFEDQIESVNTVRIRAYLDNGWVTGYGYYLDNITYYTKAQRKVLSISEAKSYTITDGDSLFAVVKNNFDVTRSDTSMVYLTVRNPGIEKRTVQLSDTCATEGNILKEFNLTDYNYATGGALVADRLWYWDSQRTKPVEDPEYVDVEAGETYFYVYVDDECVDIPGELVLNVFAIPEVTDATVSVCEVPSLGGDRGLIDLDDYISSITTDTKATVEWYSDYEYTSLLGTTSSIPVSDGTSFYAKIYYSDRCAAFAKLTVSVILVDDITFKDFSVCYDAGVQTLSASPSGGSYTGTGVSGITFDPKSIGTGSTTATTEITYKISNEGCTNSKTVTATVNPHVSVSVTNKSGKLQTGQQADIEAVITPTSSDYKYTWSDASKLESTNTLTPKTVALSEPTYYTIDVENTVTGCTASGKVLVDVYAPVKVSLEVEPVCSGATVEISANRTGGTGPFTYEWTLDPSVAYTAVNDSLIQIANIQSSVSVTVKVTDKTENDVVSATETQIVYPNPVVTVEDEVVCQGDALSINPSVSDGTPVYVSQWTGNTEILTTEVSSMNATIDTKNNTGTYHLIYTVTDDNKCTDTKTVAVTINKKPVVEASAQKTTACFGDVVNLEGTVTSGNSTGATHLWVSPTYSTADLSSTEIPNPTYSSYVSGVHTFQYIMTDANGCKDTSDVVSVRIEPRPTVTIDPLDPVCASKTGVTLSAKPTVSGISDATFTYAWEGNLTPKDSETPVLDISQAGVKDVSLVVTANNGCTSEKANLQVTVNPNPLAEISTKDIVVCAEDTVTMQANTSSSNVSYTWDATLPLTETTGSSITIVPSNPVSTETVTSTVMLTVTDNTTGCASKDTTTLTTRKLPEITLDGDKELCAGESVELKPMITYVSTDDYTIKWYLDTEQLSNTNVENPIYTQTGTSTYKIGIQITDSHGCVGEDEISIQGLENPTPDAGEDRIEEWKQQFTLNGSASGGTPEYSWLWSPADSLTSESTLQSPTSVIRETTKYTLTVTDSKGCKGTDDVTITIIGQPLSVSIVQSPDPFCYGNEVSLEAIPSGGTGVYAYEWYNLSDLTTIIGSEKTLKVTLTEDTGYKVILKSVGERPFDPASTSKYVVVSPLPSIAVRGGNEQRVCQGSTTTIIPVVSNGAAPYTYEWYDGSPIVVKTETYMFNNSELVGSQTLKLVVSDAIGCKDSVNVVVNVDDLPTVSIDPVIECINVEAIATAKTSGGASPYVYTWTGIHGMTSQGNTAKFTLSESGTYTVKVQVEDDHTCQNEAEAIVTIKPESDLALDPTYSVCADAELTLDINPSGIPGNYTMHWVGGDKNRIVDSTVVTQTIFKSANEGTYTLYYTIADEYDCPRKDTTVITVFPAVKLDDIADKTACSGIDLELEPTILAGNPTSFTWIGSVTPKNEKETVFNSTREGEFEVTVIAGDQHCSDTKVFNVYVQPNPVVEILGAPIKLVDYTEEALLTSQLVKYTSGPFTHSWSESANIKSGADEASAITKPITKTTDFTYTITDNNGCVDSASITLQTEMIITKITHLCDGTEATIDAATLVDASEVCLTDAALDLCIGESAYLIPQFVSGYKDGLLYSWKDDEGTALGTDINLYVTPTKEVTIYTLTVANEAGFSVDALFTVIAHPLPTAEISVSPDYSGKFYTNSVLVLDGNPTSSEYGVEFVTHEWTTDPSLKINNSSAQRANITSEEEIDPLTLTYSVVDNNGCKTTTTKDIVIEKQIVPVVIGDNVCVNTTAEYKLNVDYPAGTEYIWSVSGGTIIGATNTSKLEVYWTETENTTVTVSIYPPYDRPIEKITTNVYVTPMPDAYVNGQIHVCVGESAKYEAINNIPSMELVYSWDIVDDYGTLIDITHPVADMATALWEKEGQDTVIMRAMYGACTLSDSLTVYIHPTPDADFTYAATEDVYFMEEDLLRHTDSIFVDKQVAFTNLTTQNNNFDYFWDFIGDGVFSENSYDAVYKYDEVGDFTVQLMVVENTWGCKNIVSKPLTVVPNPNCGLTFPNAFTPDLSDNNTFYPVFKAGVLETGYELRVYNRWGTLLWSTTDLYGEWDGVYKGSISKQDVYVYHCKATCEDVDPQTGEHRVLNVKGDVTIIR